MMYAAGHPRSGHIDHEDDDLKAYLNPAFLSHLAVWVKDQVPRGNRTKRSGVEHWGFTGKEIVDTILKALPPIATLDGANGDSGLSLVAPPPPPLGAAPSPTTTSSPSPSSLSPLASSSKLATAPDPRRKLALSIARTLQQSLWFHEVDFDDHMLKDEGDREGAGASVAGSGSGHPPALSNQVYTFLFVEGDDVDDRLFRDSGGGGRDGGRNGVASADRDSRGDRHRNEEDIPTGVVTSLTRCESLVCTKENAEGGFVLDPLDGTVLAVRGACYSFDCPNRITKVGHLRRSRNASISRWQTADSCPSPSPPQNALHRVGSTLSTGSGLVEAVSHPLA